MTLVSSTSAGTLESQIMQVLKYSQHKKTLVFYMLTFQDIHFIRVQHEGSDSWKGDWVDIHFNFGDTYRCPSGDKRWYLFKDDYEHAYCDPK